jgi:ATP-dependent RNA helicase RhlE
MPAPAHSRVTPAVTDASPAPNFAPLVARRTANGDLSKFTARTPSQTPEPILSVPPSFTSLHLHPSLQHGLKELGFARPTPIQSEAIPPGLEGRDVLACAMTGSGKTYAFLLPILHQLMEKPRGRTRALVITPTRELAAQILESMNDVAVHTPLTGAAIFGGVGMGPQEHAFRTGVDVMIATPGRLLDHFRSPYAKLDALEFLVLDEADRMLDMGFLPEIKKILRHLPQTKRQTLFFSATMPAPIAALTREMLSNPVNINLQRKAAPAVGITQAIYPVKQDLKSGLLVELLKRGDMPQALVFTRTKHRANRLASQLVSHGIKAERIHGNRSQAQRTLALAGFKDGTYTVLVATDIAARGIDVEDLGHVVNFDVPMVPEDYIHRVGRTARAEAVGEAFTFVSPEEEGDLRQIEKAIGRQLPRVTVAGFDYDAKVQGKLEVPLAERIAEIKKKKSEDRARSAAKQARRAASGGAPAAGGGGGGRSGGSGRGGASGAGAPVAGTPVRGGGSRGGRGGAGSSGSGRSR